MVRSYLVIVNVFQNDELSLSLGALKPLYTFEIYAYIFSPSSLRKGHLDYGGQLTMFTTLIFALSFLKIANTFCIPILVTLLL